MGGHSESVTPTNTDSEDGEAFTDGDFGDSDEEQGVERAEEAKTSQVPVHETVNRSVKDASETNGHGDAPARWSNGHGNGDADDVDTAPVVETRRESQGEQSPSILGILGNQHHQAEQRLAARRAARAEAREIRMRELERQQREQEDHADKAYDMYTESVGRRGRLAALSPGALHSPRRSSEDSADDGFCLKDLRHELKEVEEKFRKAMILNAQLDNDKAALAYQLELLKDRLEELQEEHAQLQREHKEKCSAYERLRREHASLEREVTAARDAVRARDTAAQAAGFAFVEAGVEPCDEEMSPGEACGSVPALALVSRASEQLLNEAGEGTLDVRLQNILNQKLGLESEVRKLKLQLNEERAARHNGVAHAHDHEYENELETLRKCVSEAKARAARAEAEAALQGAAVARLEAQVSRLRARQDHQDEHEEQLKQERRRLQREAREALNRVEELETENSHLTKRLDKLKNAKSALLKEL